MHQSNMHEAKTKLSKLADLAVNGETVVIAKAGKPYVDIVPHKSRKQRTPGGYKIEMTHFNDVDDEIETLFNGE